MSSISQWGRWVLNGRHLVYLPNPGVPDPGYELDISRLRSAEQLGEWLEHLREKAWIQAEDLTAFTEACTALMEAHVAEMKVRLADEDDLPVPPAMPWDVYRAAVEVEWSRFLDEADSRNEAAFQGFLERHPSLLPGPYGTPWGKYHGPLFDAVFSQPELPGIRARRPDFLLFEQDSATVYAVLIEIEAPAKPWCTRAGTPSSALTQAIDQLRDWKAWFSDPINVLAFQKLYGLEDHISTRRFVQHYVLIYGRREEATQLESFARKRHDLAGSDEFFMSYDRLEPNGSAQFTLKLDRSGPDTNFRVLSVVPTITMNKAGAIWFTGLVGGEEAISSNPLISDARKTFLLERLGFARGFSRERSNDSRWSEGILNWRSYEV